MKIHAIRRARSLEKAAALSVLLLMAARAGVDFPRFPALSLGMITRGDEAVLALGDQLPVVAQAYGLTGEQLTRQLRSDSSLAVDPEGRLLFLDVLSLGLNAPVSPNIPSPPVRTVTNPGTDIPSPPVRTVTNPGTDIPSPPVRTVTNPGTDIPSPPVRTVANPGTDIPSPPVRTVANPSTDIPSPPVKAAANPTIDIPSPPVRGVTGLGGNVAVSSVGNPSGSNYTSEAESVELQSNAGASRVIHLDFNGASVSGTVWNEVWFQGQSFFAPPFDQDGVPQSLNAVERSQIVEIWKRVSEDFSPFDVNVTTSADPKGSVPAGQGIRVLVTPMGQAFSGYSAISYVGSFASAGSRWDTVLVFPDVIGPGRTKAIAEAISHQIGHSLGLFHQGLLGGSPVFAGTGSAESGWAPIMGDASVRALSRWSRGDYPGASNAQDDLARIQLGGLRLREDDHGDSMEAASYLPLGTRWTVGGLVSHAEDRDVLAFESGQGTVSIKVSPEEVGANLDIQAQLLNQAGVVVAESAPADSLACRFDLVVPAGKYFLAVRGSGYGSLGRYTVSGAVPQPVRRVPPVSVISPTPAAVEVFVPFVFDGSLSFDQDDAIASYVWDFGDGTRRVGVNVKHAFQAPGSYGVTLTVTDQSGLSHSSAIGLRITPPNLAPRAVISTGATSGYAPLAIVFDGSKSVDPDGTVVAYRWDFSDGQRLDGPVVRRDFTLPGVHRVTLTVTDNKGGQATSTTSITVSQREICVGAITVRTVDSGLSRVAYATVRITMPDGSPVAGATVTGSWLGAVGQSRGVTDAKGVVEVASPRATKTTKLTFTMTGVSLQNARYNPALNRVPSLTVVVGP